MAHHFENRKFNIAPNLGPYQAKITQAQQLLKEIYSETDIYISIDPDTIVYQNSKCTPYLQAFDHVTEIKQQLEELRVEVENLTERKEFHNSFPTDAPDPILEQTLSGIFHKPAIYVPSASATPNQPKNRKSRKKKR